MSTQQKRPTWSWLGVIQFLGMLALVAVSLLCGLWIVSG
jgi:hypothetical protein